MAKFKKHILGTNPNLTQLKEIKNFCKRMPTVFTVKTVHIKGKDLFNKGNEELLNAVGKISTSKIDNNLVYSIPNVKGAKVNHERRMIQAFKDEGNLGVLKYVHNFLLPSGLKNVIGIKIELLKEQIKEYEKNK